MRFFPGSKNRTKLGPPLLGFWLDGDENRPSDGTMFDFKENFFFFLLFVHYFHHSDFQANEKNKRLCSLQLIKKIRLSCALFWYE